MDGLPAPLFYIVAYFSYLDSVQGAAKQRRHFKIPKYENKAAFKVENISEPVGLI